MKKTGRFPMLLKAAVLTCAGLTLAGTSMALERPLEKVLVGELPVLPSIGNFIALEKGWFEELGLDVEFRMFKVSTKLVPLLMQGSLDVGGGGVSAGMYNALAKGGGARIVADRGHHPYGDSKEPVHGIVLSGKLHRGEVQGDALRGKSFAVSGRGGPQEIYLELFLGHFGLGLGDVEVLTMPYPNMLPALAGGRVFGAALLEPFLTLSQRMGTAVPALTDKELYPGQQGGVLVFSGPFIGERRATAVKYMVGYLRGVRYYNDYLEGRVDESEIFDILSRHTAFDDIDLFKRIGKPSLNSDGGLNVEGMERDMDWFRERGYLDGRPEISRIVDLSFLDEANRLLGKQGGGGKLTVPRR